MFGCIVAGRLVQTDCKEVGPGKYVFELDDAATIKHVVFFLTGTIPFQTGFGSSIFISDSQDNWNYLGMLTNQKPSAIFKLNLTDVSTVKVGISIEPLDELAAIVAANSLVPASPTALKVPNTVQIAQKIGESLFNYISSFSRTFDNVEIVPLKTVQEWFESFMRKLRTDPQGFERQLKE